jgi:hypothetical protein
MIMSFHPHVIVSRDGKYRADNGDDDAEAAPARPGAAHPIALDVSIVALQHRH